MFYEFSCKEHGKFTVSQPMDSEHKAYCKECGEQAQRIYGYHEIVWIGTVYRPDGSRREANDYACLKG